MKTKILYLSLFIGLVSLMINMISCNKEEDNVINEEVIQEKYELKELTLLGDEIYLPIGTKWFYTNKEHNRVEFELPKGYQFLLHNETTDQFKFDFIGGGYSCTCSKGGSCTVFYNGKIGYGCLQSTCNGSCTGKASGISDFKIEGVVYDNNDTINIDSKVKASLSEIGKRGIFNVAEFRNEIKRNYDIIYKNHEKPNFSMDNLEKENLFIAKTYLFGFEIGLVVPNDINLGAIIPNLKNVVSKNAAKMSCKCSGGGSGCKLESKGRFGYEVYYCTGCTTCTMSNGVINDF